MVLGELGAKIAEAWRKVTPNKQIDQEVLNDMLKEFYTALVEADVDVQVTPAIRRGSRACASLPHVLSLASAAGKQVSRPSEEQSEPR